MNTIEFNKVYDFDFTNEVQFGDLPINVLHKLYRDGRVASKFLEHYLPIWFPEVRCVDQPGYDHVHNHTGRKYDLKGFTNSGSSYAPSKMLGGNRKINITEMHNHAKTIDYVFSDIVEFPKVRIIFKKGTELIKTYPSGKIPLKSRSELFK